MPLPPAAECPGAWPSCGSLQAAINYAQAALAGQTTTIKFAASVGGTVTLQGLHVPFGVYAIIIDGGLARTRIVAAGGAVFPVDIYYTLAFLNIDFPDVRLALSSGKLALTDCALKSSGGVSFFGAIFGDGSGSNAVIRVDLTRVVFEGYRSSSKAGAVTLQLFRSSISATGAAGGQGPERGGGQRGLARSFEALGILQSA
jgi:hypothetical protein